MVRFRRSESGDIDAFILHPVEWGATPRRLFQSIERWRTMAPSGERTSISGPQAIAGHFYVPTIAQSARGFRISGTVTLVGAISGGMVFSSGIVARMVRPWHHGVCLHFHVLTCLVVPAVLHPPALPRPVDAD